jgi:hypothetical protein
MFPQLHKKYDIIEMPQVIKEEIIPIIKMNQTNKKGTFNDTHNLFFVPRSIS